MTPEKIRAALPTHILLRPAKDKFKKGDVIITAIQMQPYYEIASFLWGKPVTWDGIYGRPIPPHILDNQAFWIWCRGKHMEAGLSNFEIEEIGGADVWHTQQRAGRLYDKWLLEQMEDV